MTESQSKDVRVATNHLVTIKCTATFVTRYNASKKRRFITQIKSAKVTVSGYGFNELQFLPLYCNKIQMTAKLAL